MASQAQSKVATIPSILSQRAETSVCPTFTIAHVNASPELDVVSALSKNLSPVCDATVPTSGRQSSAAAGEGLGREAGRARRVGRHEPLGLELAEVPPVDVADARAPRRLAVALVAPGGGEILDFGAARGGL